MKRNVSLLVITAFSLLAIVLLSSSQAQEKPSGPRIFFQEKNFDFKDVEEGSVLEHSFKVWNRGDEALVIERVSPA